MKIFKADSADSWLSDALTYLKVGPWFSPFPFWAGGGAGWRGRLAGAGWKEGRGGLGAGSAGQTWASANSWACAYGLKTGGRAGGRGRGGQPGTGCFRRGCFRRGFTARCHPPSFDVPVQQTIHPAQAALLLMVWFMDYRLAIYYALAMLGGCLQRSLAMALLLRRPLRTLLSLASALEAARNAPLLQSLLSLPAPPSSPCSPLPRPLLPPLLPPQPPPLPPARNAQLRRCPSPSPLQSSTCCSPSPCTAARMLWSP